MPVHSLKAGKWEDERRTKVTSDIVKLFFEKSYDKAEQKIEAILNIGVCTSINTERNPLHSVLSYITWLEQVSFILN